METEEIQSKLNLYADVFKEARNRVNDDQIATAIVQEIGKHMRVAQMAEEGGKRFNGEKRVRNPEDPATPKQIAFLKRLGVKEFSGGLTRGQASQQIDELLEQQSE